MIQQPPVQSRVPGEGLRGAMAIERRLLKQPSNPSAYFGGKLFKRDLGRHSLDDGLLCGGHSGPYPKYTKRRAYAHQKFNSIPGISCVNAKGAFYLFPNISKTGLKSSDFCAKLLEQQKVAAVPGIAFGADDYIRISYATSMANIEKGLDRMGKFVKSIAK